MNVEEFFNIIGAAKKEILEWTKVNSISLHRVEYVPGFGYAPARNLAVWFFYVENKDIEYYESDATTPNLRIQFEKILRSHNYPEKDLRSIRYHYDSDENVKKNYEGSYYSRLR